MSKQTPVFEFEEDSLWGEVFGFADIPENWTDGNFICELDRSEILEVLYKTADFVDEEVFDEGGFGTCGAYYKVYASDVGALRKKLTSELILLLENTYGKDGYKED
jgi:hypothetical protein